MDSLVKSLCFPLQGSHFPRGRMRSVESPGEGLNPLKSPGYGLQQLEPYTAPLLA